VRCKFHLTNQFYRIKLDLKLKIKDIKKKRNKSGDVQKITSRSHEAENLTRIAFVLKRFCPLASAFFLL